MVKSEDFVILAVPDSLPVLEPDSLAPPTFILVGMAVLMIDVSVEKRCVQYKNCNAGRVDKARHSVLVSNWQCIVLQFVFDNHAQKWKSHSSALYYTVNAT